jgi:hypothetical protein
MHALARASVLDKIRCIIREQKRVTIHMNRPALCTLTRGAKPRQLLRCTKTSLSYVTAAYETRAVTFT